MFTFTTLQNLEVFEDRVQTDCAMIVCFHNDVNEKTGSLSCWWRSLTKATRWQRLHASAFDFFFEVLALAGSAGSGEPGGSVGGMGASSTSPSGSRGRQESSKGPRKKMELSVESETSRL